MSALLLACIFLPLTLSPQPVMAADTLTEKDFSETLLAALNKTLKTPLTFPIQTDNPVFNVTSLDLSNQGITNLKGIEHFTQLYRLNLDYNKLTSLANVKFPNSIRYLSLAHNSIAKVDDIVWPNNLTELNLRNNRLSNPLGFSLPAGLTLLQLDNNFLTSKIFTSEKRTITYNGNFIYEPNKIKPADIIIKDIKSISLSPGGQFAIPFVNIVSSTNPNNNLPSGLFKASLVENSGVVTLDRQEYRYLIQANKAGKDTLRLSLNLTSYMEKQYQDMNLTFHEVYIPITVWQSASERTEENIKNNGDSFIINALEGRSNNAVVDASRFSKGQVSFSPGLIAQLAAKNKKLILSHIFGNITMDSDYLKYLANRASVHPKASLILTLDTYEQRPVGYGPSRFSQKEISSLPYNDFKFEVQLQIPGKKAEDLEVTSPLTVTLHLKNQDFTAWDYSHLTAFKDDGLSLFLLGGTYNKSTGFFTYQIDSAGRYGLGTRGRNVKWMDLSINSAILRTSDDEVIRLNPTPILYKGRTMVPARAIFETMGANVRWSEYNRMTVISYGSKTFYLQADTPIPGTDQQPYILSGRMLVPLRYLSTEIGASVLWWSNGNKIRIVY